MMTAAGSSMTTPIIGVLATSLILCLINFKRHNRYKQIFMPAISLVYCVAVLALVYTKAIQLENFLKAILNATEILGTSFSDKVLGSIAYRCKLIAIINLAVFGAFVPFKIAMLGILKMVMKNRTIKEMIPETFYEKDKEYGEYFLKDEWTYIREMLKWLTIVSALISGVFIGFMMNNTTHSEFTMFVIPVVVLIIIIECFNYMNGYCRSEYLTDIDGDDSYSRRVGNFVRIREIYESIFPHVVLSAYTAWNQNEKKGIADVISELKDSDSDKVKVISKYFDDPDKKKTLDADCIRASIRLIEGKNVVFNNPFYRDLSDYLLLPIIDKLLDDKKVLLIIGRNSSEEDIHDWISTILSQYTKMSSLWRVSPLSIHEPDCEIGLLTNSQIYDDDVVKSNAEFFANTGLVLFFEPSLTVNTGQVGLSIITQSMRNELNDPVLCIVDRITDGLVDTMSHLLKAEITEVVAAPMPMCTYTGMSFNADGDYLRQKLFSKQTKHLGNGFELAAVAIKNQIPHVTWVSETKSPVRDIRWIAGQYYHTLCKYMNIHIQQESISEKIDFISNLWGTKETKEQFIIVDDEFNNIFSMMRIYLSRGREQSFVNIMSDNYLLRDYMRCNTRMFMTNPDVIPSIVPEYCKSERNTLIKLLVQMNIKPVLEQEIANEFSLIGIRIEYADVLNTLLKLVERFTDIEENIFSIHTSNAIGTDGISSSSYYYIDSDVFNRYFAETLRNAYYIVEEEKLNNNYVNGKLFGHVVQTTLPGQYVVYDGKYYQVKYVSTDSGVVLRRASDNYDGRKYYRQIRHYSFNDSTHEEIITSRVIKDTEVTVLYRSFTVTTTGYLEMRDNCDLKNARVIDLSADPSVGTYTRRIKNKQIIRIRFEGTDVETRYTLCMLLSELFRTMFSEGWHYLAALCYTPEGIEGMLNYLLYDFDISPDDDCIYIIEDSEIDLGLLNAVEKNLDKLLEIVTDFVEWHFDKMKEREVDDPKPDDIDLPIDFREPGLFARLAAKIGKLFGSGKDERIKIEEVEDVEFSNISDSSRPTEEENDVSEESEDINADSSDEDESFAFDAVENDKKSESKADYNSNDDKENIDVDLSVNSELEDQDGTDIFEESAEDEFDTHWEDYFEEKNFAKIRPTRYQHSCYMKFGFKEIDKRVKLESVYKYLKVRGYGKSSLNMARCRDVFEDRILDIDGGVVCDFCGMPLSGVSYEVLDDGRMRCNDCANTAINDIEVFKTLFKKSLDAMMAFYKIDFRIPIVVRTCDAAKIAKGYGSIFTPYNDFTPRVVGYATRPKNGKFIFYVENGSPRLSTIDTMIHEMTHIWQYKNWNDAQINRLYGNGESRDLVYEGMATWAATQYLYLIGEVAFAHKTEQLLLSRPDDDIYKRGFIIFCQKYPLVRESEILRKTPFSQFPPI